MESENKFNPITENNILSILSSKISDFCFFILSKTYSFSPSNSITFLFSIKYNSPPKEIAQTINRTIFWLNASKLSIKKKYKTKKIKPIVKKILIDKKLVDILRLVEVVIVNVGVSKLAANEQVLLQVWNSLLVLPGTAAQ